MKPPTAAAVPFPKWLIKDPNWVTSGKYLVIVEQSSYPTSQKQHN